LVRFWDDRFTNNQRTTIGVDYKARELTIAGEDVKMQIWDTAGQERFRSMTSAFYVRAQGVILAFDVRQRDSFTSLSKWLDDIRRDAPPGVSIMLCANKCDQKEEKWEVPREEFEEFAQEQNLPLVQTSGKSGLNVVELFTKLGSQILEEKKDRLQQVSMSGESVMSMNSEDSMRASKLSLGRGVGNGGIKKKGKCC